VAEQPRDALGDRQSQAEPLPAAVEPAEFLEDGRLVGLGDARAGVAHLDAQPRAVAPAAEHDAPVRGVAHRVGQEVLQRAPQQLRVAAHPGLRGHVIQAQPLVPGQHAELGGEVLQHVVHAERLHVGREAAGVEARDVEQAGQQAFRRRQRAVDVADRAAMAGRGGVARCLREVLRQRVGEQVRGVERSGEVVADRREEAGLRAVGALGLGLGALELGGTRDDALLERLGDALELGSVRRNAVTSVKVATKPPPGIGVPRISTTAAPKRRSAT
jgi:hypothetical protein